MSFCPLQFADPDKESVNVCMFSACAWWLGSDEKGGCALYVLAEAAAFFLEACIKYMEHEQHKK